MTFTAAPNNLWHANTGSDDDTADADPGERQPAAAGADGDRRRRRQDTAAINLGTGVFQIEDDGPSNITPRSVIVTNGSGSRTASLDIVDTDTDNNYGADGGTVDIRDR